FGPAADRRRLPGHCPGPGTRRYRQPASRAPATVGTRSLRYRVICTVRLEGILDLVLGADDGRLRVNEAIPLPNSKAFAVAPGAVERLSLLERVVVVISLEGRDVRPIRS